MRASDMSLLQRITRAMESGGDVVALTSGNNTVTVQSGADICVIIPVHGNTATITLKGVAGDTGFAVSGHIPCIITPTGASFVINVDANTTANIIWLREQ